MSVLLKHLFVLRLRLQRLLGQGWRRQAAPAAPLLAPRNGPPLPFFHGANLPWVSYGNDFGTNGWNRAGGIANPEKRLELRAHLAALKGQEIGVIRWFLFCDGRAGIGFTRAGTPTGPDARLFADVDAALEELAAADMKVIFVLFDFLWFDRAKIVQGVQTGGRTSSITNAYKQQRLRRRVLRPLFARYGRSPQILAWDIVNEPEWATRGWGGGIIGPSVPFRKMRRFLRRVARLVRRHTGQLVTVGLGNATGLPLARRCLLDFYQVHWYDRWQEVAPLEQPVSGLGIDRPLLLGEFPTRNASQSPRAIIETARQNGYCGALAWSWLAEDEFSGMNAQS